MSDFEPTYQRPRDLSPIHVDRWPSEVPLLLVVGMISLGVWLLATISIIGIIYGAILGVIFFVMHIGFVAHVRGNGVRLGLDQFPELYAAVENLSRRMGLNPVPETYLMQAGGTLNAFASKFLRSNIVVLYSDLLEACGDDDAARDMIVAHELGHIRAGHLKWTWFLIPGSCVPFLGTALSRAREYTCDRYGLAGAGRRESALLGLTILAAGGKHARQVNREAMVRQRQQLNTGFMRLGEWLSTHPPLTDRIAALDPALDTIAGTTTTGTVRAVALLAGAFLLPMAATVLAAAAFISMAAKLAGTTATGPSAPDFGAAPVAQHLTDPAARRLVAPEPAPAAPSLDVDEGLRVIKVRMDLESLANVVEREKTSGNMPPNVAVLYAKFGERNPELQLPRDPYDGDLFGYEVFSGYYVLRSAGPDKVRGTSDDIIRDSRAQ